jgi:hypothetical protein
MDIKSVALRESRNKGGTCHLAASIGERFLADNAADLQNCVESKDVPYDPWSRKHS